MSKILNSLQSRLLITAFFLLVLFCVVASYSLDRALYNSVISSEQEKIELHKKSILSIYDIQDNQFYLPLRPINLDAFNDEKSPVFALVFDHEGRLVWKSWSTKWVINLERFIYSYFQLESDEPYNQWESFYYSNEIIESESVSGETSTFKLVVFQSLENVLVQQQAFRKQMAFGLSSLAFLLLLVLGTSVFWGLKPLRKVAVDLKRIKQGKTEQLSGKYPSEMTPVITNINALIEAERAQRERYKKTLGDLAHSLKTPLAVMNTLEVAEQKDIMHEQIQRMDDIISYQLNRAVISHKNKSVVLVDIHPSVNRIINALKKAYFDKGVSIELAFELCKVPISEDDAMEVFGNLIENAFKYTDDQIKISMNETSDVTQVIIEDNGPGIDDDRKQVILQRGERADTQQPGQGIGLSVVVDILSSYNAGISVEQSDMGGAKFLISF